MKNALLIVGVVALFAASTCSALTPCPVAEGGLHFEVKPGRPCFIDFARSYGNAGEITVSDDRVRVSTIDGRIVLDSPAMDMNTVMLNIPTIYGYVGE